MTVSVNGTTGITFNDASTQNTAATGFGFKNRIINGAMMIDQRNASASVTPASGDYTLDRWRAYQSVASKFSVQQNAGAVTPPVGFVNYLGVTSLSSYSIGASDFNLIRQNIEGFNIADLGWGTANAQAITISFWVRSSLTGTFGGSLQNSAQNRAYPFTYTISSANTWEQKSLTIAGDTTGTWLTNNSLGIVVNFGLGVGSTSSGTAGSWSGSNFFSATGATSVVGTNGATFYITGVQLEKGSTATSFDYRPYGTELALCQRYYYRILAESTASTFTTGGYSSAATFFISFVSFPTTMRTAPTALEQSGTASNYLVRQGSTQFACSSVPLLSPLTTSTMATVTATVASGLTAGQSGVLCANSTTAGYLGWSAEL
jgi:hypothetical protein